MSEVVLTQDISSGKIHKRQRGPGGDLTYEADNLDEAGDYRIVSWDVLETADPDQLCARCFPVDQSGTDQPTDEG